jgi:hypothetical protein
MVRDARIRAPHHEGFLILRSIAQRCVSKDEAIIEIALAGTVPHDIVIQPDEET